MVYLYQKQHKEEMVWTSRQQKNLLLAVVKSLCQGLEITVAELMDGEETEKKSIRTYDDDKIMDLLKRTQGTRTAEEHPVRCLTAHNWNCLAGAVAYHWRVGCEEFLFGTSSGCFRCRNAGRYLCGRKNMMNS